MQACARGRLLRRCSARASPRDASEPTTKTTAKPRRPAEIGSRQEGHVVAAGEHQRAAVVRLHHEAEHDAEHHRQKRHLEVAHRVSDHAEQQRHADVKEARLDGVHTGHDEGVDEAHEIRLRPVHQPETRRHDQVAENQHRDVRDEETGEETVDHVRILHEEHRPGNQTVNQKAAEQDRRRVRARDTEAEHRARAPCTRPCCWPPPAQRSLPGEPLPNSSLCDDQRRASLYARNAEIVPPPPGMMPSNVPITEPISCGLAIRRHIAGRGNLMRAAALEAFSHPARRSAPAARRRRTAPPSPGSAEFPTAAPGCRT